MRISEAIKLGHANLTAHKGRSLAIVITISVLFGLIMGVNFILQGLEDNALRYSDARSEGKIYVEGRYRGNQGNEVVRQRVEKYHGEILGEITKAKLFGEQEVLYIVSPEVVEHLLTQPLDSVPADKLPVVMSEDMMQRLAEAKENGDEIYFGGLFDMPEEDYEIVGMIDDAHKRNELGEEGEINLLNLVLVHMGAFGGYEMLVVDDGTGQQALIEKARQECIERVQAIYEGHDQDYELYIPDLETEVKLVAMFTNPYDAYKYTLLDDEKEFGYHYQQYEVREIFGNQTQIIGAVADTEKMIRVLVIVLLVVAVVVMAFTFAHIVAAEAPIIALYRSLGAQTSDTVKIYLAYLLELCVYAVILATVIGMLLAGVVTLMESGALQELWTNDYGVELPGKIILIGFNWKYLEVVGLMLLVAPVAFLLTVDQLSPKRIAQRLKED